ncbi:MAG TPA: ATP synthase F1 subunit delta [Pirellulaceae bacterium]
MVTPLPSLESRSRTADVQRQQIGEVYAKALLAALGKGGGTEEALRQFGELVKLVVERYPRFQAILANPRLPAERKIELLDRVLDQRAMVELQRFLKVVARKGRLDCLREMYESARQLWNSQQGVVEVKVSTAHPLDGKTRAHIEQSLTQALKSAVEIRSHVDPDLIGGIAIRVGDQVYDGTVSRRLQRMATDAVEQAVATIRSQSQRFTSESNA